MAKEPAKQGANRRLPPIETRFKPGQSGNPAGRPTGTSLTDRLRKLIEKDDGKGAERIIDAAVRAAEDGDFRFFKEIMDRIDGPIVVKQEHAGADGAPLTVVIERAANGG
jgi:hypothetical protein